MLLTCKRAWRRWWCWKYDFLLCWEGSLWFICCVFAPWLIWLILQSLFISLVYKTQNHQPFVAVNRQKQAAEALPRGPDMNLHVFLHSAWAPCLSCRTRDKPFQASRRSLFCNSPNILDCSACGSLCCVGDSLTWLDHRIQIRLRCKLHVQCWITSVFLNPDRRLIFKSRFHSVTTPVFQSLLRVVDRQCQ